jgi:hypothetical protein
MADSQLNKIGCVFKGNLLLAGSQGLIILSLFRKENTELFVYQRHTQFYTKIDISDLPEMHPLEILIFTNLKE